MVKGKRMNVITLTINPAIDVHISLEGLSVGSDNLGRITRRDLGGKGVNVSRALLSLGVESVCLLVAGRENGNKFALGLMDQGLDVDYCLVDGAVRENFNIHSREGDTVIATAGPPVTADDVARLSEHLFAFLYDPAILVFSGRIPEGSDKEAIINMLLEAKAKGASLILDSRSLSACDISRLAPLMIKPNLDEARLLLKKEAVEPVAIARELAALGAEYVLLTLGGEGLVLTDGTDVVSVPALQVEVTSTVGAGDSTVASFISSYILGRSLRETALHAVATSAAACMTEGTLPPDPCEINSLHEKIKNTSQTREV